MSICRMIDDDCKKTEIRLPNTVNSRLTDTSLLRTLCKSPAKPIINYIAGALAITDSHTSCGPQQTFLLFYSRYNGHLVLVSIIIKYNT